MAQYAKFEFNYATIIATPFARDKRNSSQLLRHLIQILIDEQHPEIIDRHKNRKNAAPRQIFSVQNRLEKEGKRCFGKLVLIKNKAPMIWGGKDVIEQIERPENKEFIEVTNYCIHFGANESIMMIEFNNEGPRLNDIEFYFRQLFKKFQLAKYIQSIMHLETSYEQLDKDIHNIFNIKVKVNSAFNNRFDWFNLLTKMNAETGYKDIRLELFYKYDKNNNGKYQKNIRGIDFARNIIGWLRRDNKNIDYVDDLKMTYQVDEDSEPIQLDFLNNKITSCVKIPLEKGEIYKPAVYRELVNKEFNYFLTNGKTTNIEDNDISE